MPFKHNLDVRARSSAVDLSCPSPTIQVKITLAYPSASRLQAYHLTTGVDLRVSHFNPSRPRTSYNAFGEGSDGRRHTASVRPIFGVGCRVLPCNTAASVDRLLRNVYVVVLKIGEYWLSGAVRHS